MQIAMDVEKNRREFMLRVDAPRVPLSTRRQVLQLFEDRIPRHESSNFKAVLLEEAVYRLSFRSSYETMVKAVVQIPSIWASMVSIEYKIPPEFLMRILRHLLQLTRVVATEDPDAAFGTEEEIFADVRDIRAGNKPKQCIKPNCSSTKFTFFQYQSQSGDEGSLCFFICQQCGILINDTISRYL